MIIKTLKEIIAKLPDDAEVLVPGRDHSYRHADAGATTALFLGAGYSEEITEDHGEDSTPEAEYGKRKQVLVIS